MARSQLGTLMERSEDVPVEEYLARRRPMPHLFELTPEGPDADATALSGTVKLQGERETDVRLLVDDGERYVALATELAESLRCDVYLTPHGAHIRYVRESSSVTGDSWDAISVDRTTGEPAEWLVVRHSDLPATVPTWFLTARGRLRQSSGLVTVTLPDGIAFATKQTFRDTTYLAARMKPNSSRVTTVAVKADLGRFEISRFDDGSAQLGGLEFATLISASLDLVHPDVQIALTWPTDTAACASLDVELVRAADALNRTVWVPEPAGAAFVLPGCGEFAAVDEVGGPSKWRAYPSRLAADWRASYDTDLDGRLVPIGNVVAARFPGVPFVSVPAMQLDHLRSWYESLVPGDGLFAIDLTVLADGRLGVLLKDGRASAVGPRELRTLLRDAGWAGEDLLVLAQPPAGGWEGLVEHAQHLANQLTVDLWLPSQSAPAGESGSGGEWHLVAYGRPEDLDRRAGEGVAPRPGVTVTPRPAVAVATWSESPSEQPPVAAAPGPAAGSEVDAAVYAAVAEPTQVIPIVPDAVILPPVDGDGGHAVPWLPSAPVVNRRPIDLYLWTPLPTDHDEGWGLPSADLFLVAGQDPLRLAEHRRTGHLLRVFAPEDTAIELIEHAKDAPAAVRQRLQETGSTHLLPLAWLSDLRVTARFDLDGRGGVTARSDIDAAALAIRFEGADHGVPGLPNEVVHWPDKTQKAGAPSYLMLPEDAAIDHIVHRGFVPLSRRKPALESGHCLFEVKVRKRKAIDVPATLHQLAGFPVVGRMHDLVGLDLLLPEDDLADAVLTKIWRNGPNRRPVVEKLNGETLAEAFSTDRLELAAAS